MSNTRESRPSPSPMWGLTPFPIKYNRLCLSSQGYWLRSHVCIPVQSSICKSFQICRKVARFMQESPPAPSSRPDPRIFHISPVSIIPSPHTRCSHSKPQRVDCRHRALYPVTHSMNFPRVGTFSSTGPLQLTNSGTLTLTVFLKNSPSRSHFIKHSTDAQVGAFLL